MQLFTHRYIRASKRARGVVTELRPEDVGSIAVIKHAGLGDMVLARPFFVTLRRHFPNARLTASVIANYMNGVPEDLVDRVHVSAGKFRPRPSFRERLKSYRELGYHDLLFDLTASNDSYWITLVNKARLKFGYRHSPHSYLVYDIAIPRQIFKFEAETFLDQLGVLRLNYDWPLRFDFPRLPGRPDKPFLVYFPTASVIEKCWPAARYGALMARMAEAYPRFEHRLVYGVAEWEVALADEAMAEAGERENVRAVKDLRGGAFQTMVQQAELVIANDTGIRNLAIAMETPTLGIFHDSFVYTYLPRFGHHDVVQEIMGGHPPVDKVFDAAAALLRTLEAEA